MRIGEFWNAYLDLLNRSRIVSIVACGLIASFTLTDPVQTLNSLRLVEGPDFFRFARTQIAVSVGFKSIIFVVFATRLGFLIVRDRARSSQMAWFAGYILVLAYKLSTAMIVFGSIFEDRESRCLDCLYYPYFLWASPSLSILLLGYLMLSPVRQGLTLVAAIVVERRVRRNQIETI